MPAKAAEDGHGETRLELGTGTKTTSIIINELALQS